MEGKSDTLKEKQAQHKFATVNRFVVALRYLYISAHNEYLEVYSPNEQIEQYPFNLSSRIHSRQREEFEYGQFEYLDGIPTSSLQEMQFQLSDSSKIWRYPKEFAKNVKYIYEFDASRNGDITTRKGKYILTMPGGVGRTTQEDKISLHSDATLQMPLRSQVLSSEPSEDLLSFSITHRNGISSNQSFTFLTFILFSIGDCNSSSESTF